MQSRHHKKTREVLKTLNILMDRSAYIFIILYKYAILCIGNQSNKCRGAT